MEKLAFSLSKLTGLEMEPILTNRGLAKTLLLTSLAPIGNSRYMPRPYSNSKTIISISDISLGWASMFLSTLRARVISIEASNLEMSSKSTEFSMACETQAKTEPMK